MTTAALVLLSLAALAVLGRCITTNVAHHWWGQPNNPQGSKRK